MGWYESGQRKSKALPSKDLAEHYKQIKYAQLNSDVFTGIITADWQEMVDEYREAKKVRGVTEGTLYEHSLSLRNLERIVGRCNSKQITQNVKVYTNVDSALRKAVEQLNISSWL